MLAIFHELTRALKTNHHPEAAALKSSAKAHIKTLVHYLQYEVSLPQPKLLHTYSYYIGSVNAYQPDLGPAVKCPYSRATQVQVTHVFTEVRVDLVTQDLSARLTRGKSS